MSVPYLFRNIYISHLEHRPPYQGLWCGRLSRLWRSFLGVRIFLSSLSSKNRNADIAMINCQQLSRDDGWRNCSLVGVVETSVQLRDENVASCRLLNGGDPDASYFFLDSIGNCYLLPSCCVVLSPWDGQVVHDNTSFLIHYLLCGISRSPMVSHIIILSIYQFPPFNPSSIVIRRECGVLPRCACLPNIHTNSPCIVHHILICMRGRIHVFFITIVYPSSYHWGYHDYGACGVVPWLILSRGCQFIIFLCSSLRWIVRFAEQIKSHVFVFRSTNSFH